jgi:hypothetical protein
MTDLVVKSLEDAFAIGASVEAACFKANITKQSYYNWVKSFPDMAEHFNALREKPILKALTTINDNLTKEDTAKWYLERRMKEFHPKAELEVEEKKLNIE